ncbi:MAG: EAL domain-containing protein [Caulobacteraceae bacterium]
MVRFAQFDRLAAVDRPGAEKVLRAFAERLSEAVGGARPLAQVDRDCFAIWFCDNAGPKGAAEALKALAAHLGEPIGDTTPDVRIGAAISPNDGDDPATLLACATAALTKSNRMSPGRLAFFSDESSADAEARFSMEQALRQAIVRRELALFYQPVIDLTAGRVVGAEALLRWRHPELGSIPPAQFLPVLEQTGFIDEVGRWVLDTACRDAREFESLGLPGFRVGVNPLRAPVPRPRPRADGGRRPTAPRPEGAAARAGAHRGVDDGRPEAHPRDLRRAGRHRRQRGDRTISAPAPRASAT